MTLYTIQVSDHPEAGIRVPTDAGNASWSTAYDGPLASTKDARAIVDALSKSHRCARAFKGNRTFGKLWYAVLR